MRLVDIDKFINDFPIRLNHYDEKNGSKKFVLGIELVLDSLECTPKVEAIPVEWLEKWKKGKTSIEQVVADKIMMDYIHRGWEKENEKQTVE